MYYNPSEEEIKTTKAIHMGALIMCFMLLGIAVITLAINIFKLNKGLDKYGKSDRPGLFEKYNEKYQEGYKVKENYRDIVVKIEGNIEDIDSLVKNYISNVYGEILSFSETQEGSGPFGIFKKKYVTYNLRIPKDTEELDTLNSEFLVYQIYKKKKAGLLILF